MSNIDFKVLINRAGSEEGARILFQNLVSSLVRVKYKDARQIRPSPGDWGIDVLVGELSDYCLVWQAKYFINSVGDSQQKQIRESFEQLMLKSKENNFKVKIWTLCIPCSLSPKETKWWEGWSKKSSTKYDLLIKLMDETELRYQIESPDSEHIRSGYFGPNSSTLNYLLQVIHQHPERHIQKLPEDYLYDKALFIEKLKVGGIQEYKSAKTQFFNAELLTQEIIDKGDETELISLDNLREKIRSMWETRFIENFSCEERNEGPKLYSNLMKSIEDQTNNSLKSDEIKASFVHKQGIVHQMAENCDVGWSKDFRKQFINYYER